MIVASFYFWAAGTKLQTSKSGLYRTLLHQLLAKHPDIIERVFPERWAALCLFNEDPKAFTDNELQDCLTRIVLLLDEASTKLCLFIDGLDEFDGDHGDLIKLLTRILHGSSVKLCVASRPWVVFEEALKNKPSLRLEDLTFNDIKEYVTTRFHHDDNFSRLWGREFEFADSLIEKVVRKAAGVFLWVNLVVSSLLDGMRFGDRVSDLQRRLDSLPPDLEDLYSRILENLDPFYFEHAAQYFSLMTACQEPPSAVLFSLADEEKPEFALQLQNLRWTIQDLDDRIDAIQRRLNSRCKGLIEVGRGAGSLPTHTLQRHLLHHPTVQYLHKTVKDYIEKPDVQGRLFQGLKSPFDPHVRLCSANFVIFRVESSFEDVSLPVRVDSYSRQVAFAMRHAAQVSSHNVPIMVQVLDQLEKHIRWSGLQSVFTHRQPLSQAIMDRLFSPSDWGYHKEPTPVELFESFGDSFLSVTVKCGALKYVEARLGSSLIRDVRPRDKPEGPYPSFSQGPVRSPWRRLTEPWTRLDFRSLLARTTKTQPLDALLSDAVPVLRPNFDLVSFLLEKGANINATTFLENGTAISLWSRALAAVICSFASGALEQGQKQTWLRIVSLMLTHGARTSRRDIKWAFDAVQAYFEISGSLTVEEGTELLRSNLRLHRRGRAELQLDFLSGLILSKRRTEYRLPDLAELPG